ncbi:MAG: RNA 3'-terminal phosphate cyclase [Thermoanaerobaculia bacterium]
MWSAAAKRSVAAAFYCGSVELPRVGRGPQLDAAAIQSGDSPSPHSTSLHCRLGEHLADQLLLPMAFAGGGSFTTTPLSGHATTNLEVIRRFLDVRMEVTELRRGLHAVRVGGDERSS